MEWWKKSGLRLSDDTYLVWAGLAAVWVLVFVPHLLQSGFISDDWCVVKSGLTVAGFWDRYASWFPLFSNRPVAPLILSAFSKLCGDKPVGYIIANLAMWLTGLVLIARVLQRFFSARFLLVFLGLASFPSIASTVIFSICMQLVGVASVLFWAISFYLLDCHLRDKRLGYLAASLFFIALSLLTYEISLPFLVINLLYPFLFQSALQKNSIKIHFYKYVLPVFFILAGVLILQKMIMPHFMPVYSRLTPGSWIACLGSLISWFWALLVDFPLLINDALQRGFVANAAETVMGLSPVVVAGLFALLLVRTQPIKPSGLLVGNEETIRRKYQLLCIASIALLSASLLFVLSGTGALVSGYMNRGLTSTWILFALVTAIVSDLYWRRTWGAFVLVLIVLNACSFMLQRDNYAQSWRLQKEIALSVVKKMREANAPHNATMLGHVPRYVPYSYNDEELFQNSWDFSNALWLADRSFELNAMPLNPVNVDHLEIKPSGVTLNYWGADFSNLWFYEYNARFGTARLTKISGMADATTVAQQVSRSKINTWPLSVPDRVREAFSNRLTCTLLGAVLLVYLSVCLCLFKRGKQHGKVAIGDDCCRVCGGILSRRIKESDVGPGDVVPAHFKVTDSSYGTTYAIECCAGCGFMQSNCKDVLSYYQLMEDPEYDSGRSARIKQFKDILQELSRWTTGGRLLDVGAGTGIMVEQALARGYRAEGIEPSEWMALQAEKRGLPVITGGLPDARVNGEYGSITLLDVIEHVSDPAGLLTDIHHLLGPDGYLLVTTPDVSSLAARLMGKRWWHFRVAHISYFTPGTIELLLERCGFEVVKCKRTGWYFELSYLVERLLTFIPAVASFPLPKMISEAIVPLNLYDSMLLICRKKP